MKGKYTITIQNNTLQYKFEIRRNITIIKGDSATGKTTLIDMIREYSENGSTSGITLQCEKECVVLEGRQWKLLLENTHDSIVFIEEGNTFISTDEFSAIVKRSDNYFVLVTRESLPNLPYSVEEIYGIRSSGKFGSLKQTYHEFYRIYSDIDMNTSFQPAIVIVEDSNSGYEFFNKISENKEWQVISAEGKSNIIKLLKSCKNVRILMIADGAAFGPEMDRIMKRANELSNIAVFLPESFEWLILKSDILKDKSISEILSNPSDFIESSKYMSWEQFFTACLTEKSQDTYLRYSKSKLNDAYLNDSICEKIVKQIPEILI